MINLFCLQLKFIFENMFSHSDENKGKHVFKSLLDKDSALGKSWKISLEQEGGAGMRWPTERKELKRHLRESEARRNSLLSQVCRPEVARMTSVYSRIFAEPIMAISPLDWKAPFPHRQAEVECHLFLGLATN